jgi:predicted SprT family Zn-dependent metalloprotease
MEPTVGRIVHYLTRNLGLDANDAGAIYAEAAIITQVISPEVVHLRVFKRTGGAEDVRFVSFQKKHNEPNTWVWPPRN